MLARVIIKREEIRPFADAASRQKLLCRGVTRRDVVFVIGILVLVPIIFAPMVLRLRSASQVTTCQAHLRIIGSSLSIAAFHRDYSEDWIDVQTTGEPIRYVGLMDYHDVERGPKSRSVSIEGYIQKAGEFPRELTTSRFIWQALRVDPNWMNGISTVVDNLVCPASNDTPPTGEIVNGRWVPPQELNDFGDWRTCSYGVQVPFAAFARPGTNTPASMPILADKGPWGELAEIARQSPSEALVRSPSNDKWGPYNSPNHRRRGQNVYFADGRVEFVSTPLAGANKDNIYTAWGTDPQTGYPPSLKNPTLLPSGATDTLIYP